MSKPKNINPALLLADDLETMAKAIRKDIEENPEHDTIEALEELAINIVPDTIGKIISNFLGRVIRLKEKRGDYK